MTNYVTSKGVQSFSITITSLNLTGTATISAAGSGAYIIYEGLNPSNNGDPQLDFPYLQLTNSTTVTATVNGTGGTIVIKGCVVDGDTTNLIKSVQQGTITISAGTGTGTASISAVTNANAATHYLGFDTSVTSAQTGEIFPRFSLSGTTVTATVATIAVAGIGAYQIIEFQGTALTANAVQNLAASSSSSVTSWTATITSVTANNALTIYGGYTANSTVLTMAVVCFRGTLTNGTTFTVNVNTGEAVAKQYNASIVEFNNGVLNSAIQRGTTTLTGVTSNTSTVTSVSTTYAGTAFLGQTSNDTGFDYIEALGASVLTNATTVTTTKNNGTNNITSSWDVFEFPAFSSGSASRVFDFMGFF